MATKSWNLKVTPEEFAALLEKLAEFCDANGEPPDNYILRKVTGITEDDISHWRAYTELRADPEASEAEKEIIRKKKMLAEGVKKLDAYRTHWWEAQALKNPKTIGLVNFALKQQHNGGWTDRWDSGATEVTINVKTDSVGGDKAFE